MTLKNRVFGLTYVITEEQFSDFFITLGDKYLARGEYNTKHTSRLITTI